MENIVEFIGSPLFNEQGLYELLFRFFINIIFAFLVIRMVYFRVNKNKEFLFSLFLVNITVFFVCIILMNVKIKTGVAFGLFAIFSILRYRTAPIPIKEMSFLFVVITIAIINSFVSKKISFAEILAANTIIVISTYLLERAWLMNKLRTKLILYERIELIKPESHQELLEDLNIELTDTTLEKWAIQGTLLLNASLSVRQGSAASCMKIWSKFTQFIIQSIEERCTDVVFIAWGAFAHKKMDNIKNNHMIVSSHPSPLSNKRPYKIYPAFSGSKPFSKINELLELENEIIW